MIHPALANLDFSRLPDEDEKAWLSRILPSFEELLRILPIHLLTPEEAEILGQNVQKLETRPIFLMVLWKALQTNVKNLFKLVPAMRDLMVRIALNCEPDSELHNYMFSTPHITWREAVTKYYGV